MRGNENTDAVRERFDEYLRQNKKRRTSERFAILDMVLKMAGHFTADELGEVMRKDGFPVSSATIYATLELLVDFGLLVRQRFDNQACLYEKSSVSASTTHHHLICTSCGKVKEVRDTAFARQIEERRFAGFTQSYYTLYIYGICGACSRKRSKIKKKKD